MQHLGIIEVWLKNLCTKFCSISMVLNAQIFQPDFGKMGMSEYFNIEMRFGELNLSISLKRLTLLHSTKRNWKSITFE